ncbi:MAG: DoxX family membrane protein [Micropepsaceae bacterium]
MDQRTGPYAILLLRVTLGLLAIAHIYWKFYILDGGLDAWWNNLINLGYPNWVVIYVLIGEFIAAICLIPGIYARWVALFSVPLMIGASLYWIPRTGFFFAAGGAELPIVWTIALIVFVGLGDGPYAWKRSPPLPFIGGK